MEEEEILIDTPTPKGADFRIDSESAATWYVGKLRRIEQERAAIKAATAERLRQLDASEARLKGRFDADLKLWTQDQAKERRRKSITLPMAGATVSLRDVPEAVTYSEDPQAKTALAEIAITAGFVKISADLAGYKKYGADVLQKTGELLPGLTIRERSESLSIKFGEEKTAEHAE
jgi:hypothetical protein